MWACRWSRTGGWWVTRSARRQKWRNKTTSREVPDIPLANATVTQVMSHRVLPSLPSHKSCLAGRWIWPLSQNMYSFAAHLIFSPAGTVICQPERWLWKSQSISSLCNTQTSLSGTNNHIQVTYIHWLAMSSWSASNFHFHFSFVFSVEATCEHWHTIIVCSRCWAIQSLHCVVSWSGTLQTFFSGKLKH